MINKNFEEKTCGDGPSLEGNFYYWNLLKISKIKLLAIFHDDRHLLSLVRRIRECLERAFKSAYSYAETLEPLVEFYAANEELDTEEFMVISIFLTLNKKPEEF